MSLSAYFRYYYRQRSGAWRGWGIKMWGFSVKHKFPKYKTIFKFSLEPQSCQTPVSCYLYFTVLTLSFLICVCPQSFKCSKNGISCLAVVVNEYSTLGGTS